MGHLVHPTSTEGLDGDPVFNSLQVIPWLERLTLYRAVRGLLLVRLAIVFIHFHVMRFPLCLPLVVFKVRSPKFSNDILLLIRVNLVPVLEAAGLMDAEARLALQRALSGVLLPSPRRPHLLATTQTQASLTDPREASSAEVLMTEDLRRESSVVLCQ